MTARNAAWNGALASGATVGAGCQASFSGSPGTLGGFVLSGVPCTGAA